MTSPKAISIVPKSFPPWVIGLWLYANNKRKTENWRWEGLGMRLASSTVYRKLLCSGSCCKPAHTCTTCRVTCFKHGDNTQTLLSNSCRGPLKVKWNVFRSPFPPLQILSINIKSSLGTGYRYWAFIPYQIINGPRTYSVSLQPLDVIRSSLGVGWGV